MITNSYNLDVSTKGIIYEKAIFQTSSLCNNINEYYNFMNYLEDAIFVITVMWSDKYGNRKETHHITKNQNNNGNIYPLNKW